MSEFTYGIGSRASSCRIPTSTAHDKKGYVEDRRPASNIDPYVVAALIADTTLLKSEKGKEMYDAYTQWKAWRDVTPMET
jgi:glutamine synthetase